MKDERKKRYERVAANPFSRGSRTGKSNNARPTTLCETLPGDKCPMKFPRRVPGGERREKKFETKLEARLVRFERFSPLSLFAETMGESRNNELPFSPERYTRQKQMAGKTMRPRAPRAGWLAMVIRERCAKIFRESGIIKGRNPL